MTVVASYGMVLCGNSSDDLQQRYRGRIEKVKFGVPINEAFAHDIPATLLVLLLKVNKEGPLKKDIWRAPGNQAQVRKLSHIMQHGRLVNIANFSVYTAASVIKKFLSKLPGGIFGVENEQILFNSALNKAEVDKQRQVFYRIFCSLPVPSQHLLVLLFGTFRMVADCSETYGTKMNTDAIAISVAPSLFHSCIHDGRQVKVEDVQRFKLASEVVKNIIASFGHINLFPRECYEFYARITGRTLRVDENWLFSFQYPSRTSSQQGTTSSANLEEGRLYDCLYDEALTFVPSSTHCLSSSVGEELHGTCTLDSESCASDFLRPLTACGGDTSRSFSCLEWVHKNQARRMKSRSEWFLSSATSPKHDVFKLKTLPDTFHLVYSEQETFGNKSDTMPSPQKKSTKISPRIERFNVQTKISRQCLLERTGSGLGSKTNCTFSISASGVLPSCASRRRSWRVRSLKGNLISLKTHSLDSQDSPYLPTQHGNEKTMYERPCAHSIGEEAWLVNVISDEIWKRKRNTKTKH